MELRGGGHLVTSVSSGLRLNEAHLDEFNLLTTGASCINCFSLRQSVFFFPSAFSKVCQNPGVVGCCQVLAARKRMFPFLMWSSG